MPLGRLTVIMLFVVPVPVMLRYMLTNSRVPTRRYLAVVTVFEMFVDAPCASVGVYEVQPLKNGATSFKLSRTFAFQNAAVSTSPVGVEGKRRGRCVGYHSPYE
jgi:hypothetical protein